MQDPHVVNKVYGKWVERFNHARTECEGLPDPDEFNLIIGEPVSFTRAELWKLMRNAFQCNMTDHGLEVDLNWAHSFYKRFWAQMKQASQQKQQLLLEKQQGHVIYNKFDIEKQETQMSHNAYDRSPDRVKQLDNEIARLKSQMKASQEQLKELEHRKQHLLQIDNISHSQAVDKLREIWESANYSDDARDFIISIVQDKQLAEWFGKVS